MLHKSATPHVDHQILNEKQSRKRRVASSSSSFAFCHSNYVKSLDVRRRMIDGSIGCPLNVSSINRRNVLKCNSQRQNAGKYFRRSRDIPFYLDSTRLRSLFVASGKVRPTEMCFSDRNHRINFVSTVRDVYGLARRHSFVHILSRTSHLQFK